MFLSSWFKPVLERFAARTPVADDCTPVLPRVPSVPATYKDETADSHKARLLREIEVEHGIGTKPLALMRREMSRLKDAEERAHAPFHEVRYLMTYAITPPGPGVLVDIGSSPIYGKALQELKNWDLRSVPVLAMDYEVDPLPFADETADGVLLCEVLEHFVVDPLHCLIEINRVLRHDGFIALTTPNACSWYAVYRALHHTHPSRWPVYTLNPAIQRNHIHAREYVASEVAVLLEAAGFDRITITTRDYGISPPFCPVDGFDTSNRGETIFCMARKAGPPRKRAVQPIYLEDVTFGSMPSRRGAS